MKAIFIFVFAGLFMTSYLEAQTIVTGNITGIWTAAGNPFIVTGNITVVDSLIIQQGVIVKFQAGGWSITAGINTKLIAKGTNDLPVIFEPYQGTIGGSWDKIYLNSSGDDDVLKNCIIRFGINGISTLDSKPQIDSCQVYGNTENGIYMQFNQNCDSVMLSNIKAYDNGFSGIQFVGFGINGTTNLTGDVYHCAVFNNNVSGIDLRTDTYWNWDQAFATITVTNCSVSGNGIGVRAQTNRGNADIRIINSIVAFSKGVGIKNEGPGSLIGENDISYSCIYKNSGGNFMSLGNTVAGFGEPPLYSNSNGDSCDINFNVYFDPIFTDTTAHDYTLQGISKCINAGTSIILGQIIMDPDNTLPDIGAYYRHQYPPFINDFPKRSNMVIQNYPNPFTESTTISFTTGKTSLVEPVILNIYGQEVKRFVCKEYQSGCSSVIWDGKDNAGNQCPSGIYFCKIRVGQYFDRISLILTR